MAAVDVMQAAYNTLKPFHDAVNTAFVLLKARVTDWTAWPWAPR
jgi:hypothetical protein